MEPQDSHDQESVQQYNYDDVEPISLDDDPTQDIILCKILYSDEYKKSLGILRRLMKNKEYSERALYLTEVVIDQVSAHYTVWQYRYHIVKEIGVDLNKEFEWCEQVAIDNIKNYQIWHYKQLLVDLMLQEKEKYNYTVNMEYPLIEAMINDDSKNYHVWSYRRWLVERFELYNSTIELDFTLQRIKEDVRNNSAWNHRFFVRFGNALKENASNELKQVDQSIIDEELELLKLLIESSPQNPSSWNYLSGILDNFGYDKLNGLKEFVEEYSDLSNKSKLSNYAIELRVELFKRAGHNSDAIELYNVLAEERDKIRKNYWLFKKNEITIA
ncbi:unnamed protein product [[Candida] boidinii]|nr:hypothetical protein BVG19_g5179 [[Candida] boidinii]OWB49844.1 protein prenyltransferase activity protein [[Candida] boidinii]GMF01823.1 unnamed protein product [[Candida] boidinii]